MGEIILNSNTSDGL